MSEIKPALTPEEWAGILANRRPDLYRDDFGTPKGAHAAAAAYLHEQPFGFTWEMVRAIDYVLDNWVPKGEAFSDEAWEVVKAVGLVSTRIADLLPPEEKP